MNGLNDTQTLKPISLYLDQTRAALEKRGTEPELSIRSIPSLDNSIWGIRREEMTIIASRPSNGKSSLAVQIAHDLASQNHPVLFLSLEMGTPSLLERLFCHYCRITNSHILIGRFNEYEKEWEQFTKHIASIPLVISDSVGSTWKDLDATIAKQRTKPEAIFVDYVNLVKGSSNKEEFDEYIKKFREMSIKHKFAGVLCAQINRKSKESESLPALHQLKGSGVLEENCDMCLCVHYEHAYTKNASDMNKILVIIDKNRNGPVGMVNLCFKPEHYLFCDKEESVDLGPEDMAKVDVFKGRAFRDITELKAKADFLDEEES